MMTVTGSGETLTTRKYKESGIKDVRISFLSSSGGTSGRPSTLHDRLSSFDTERERYSIHMADSSTYDERRYMYMHMHMKYAVAHL